jgi:hypothetical protein
MARHIGIVAVSAEGAALCYRTICIEGAALLGRHAHPEVTTHTYPLADYMRHIDAGKWDEVGEMLLASAEKLRTAGADLLICPDNTATRPSTWSGTGPRCRGCISLKRWRSSPMNEASNGSWFSEPVI